MCVSRQVDNSAYIWKYSVSQPQSHRTGPLAASESWCRLDGIRPSIASMMSPMPTCPLYAAGLPCRIHVTIACPSESILQPKPSMGAVNRSSWPAFPRSSHSCAVDSGMCLNNVALQWTERTINGSAIKQERNRILWHVSIFRPPALACSCRARFLDDPARLHLDLQYLPLII